MSRRFLLAGSVLAGVGVIAGAFGAHALREVIPPDRMDVYETAVRYQMYHALALLAVSWVVAQADASRARLAGYLFIAGTIVFSGSLYTLVFTGLTWLGALTPIGGAAFIAGWILLAAAAVSPTRR